MINPCVAHRGYSSIAPENTASAIHLAMTYPYVQWVEVDVQCSSDGVPFLIHDYTLGRTTNGHGDVKDKTWAELSQLDAGSWKSKEYGGEPLLSLDDFLDLICGRLYANIELKTHDNLYPDLELKVIEALRKRHMQHDVVLTSFDRGSLSKVKQLDETIETGLIIDSKPEDLLFQLQDLKCSYLSMNYRHLDTLLVEEVIRSGISMMAWTIDDAKIMREIIELHPEIMICTNNVSIWGEIINIIHD